MMATILELLVLFYLPKKTEQFISIFAESIIWVNYGYAC